MLFRSDRKSTRLNSSHLVISYAVFCLKKKRQTRHLLDGLSDSSEATNDYAAHLSSRVCFPLSLGRATYVLCFVSLRHFFFFFYCRGPPRFLLFFFTRPFSD